MSETCHLNRQISSIMDTLVEAAVRDICKVVKDSYAALRFEVFRSEEEIKDLKRRLKFAKFSSETATSAVQTLVTTSSRRTNCPANVMSDDDKHGNVSYVYQTKPETVFTPVTPEGSKQSPSGMNLSINAEVCLAASKDQRHITCLQFGESPRIDKCTTCCSLYHCPFCQPSVFKPNEFHRIVPHIQTHQSRAIHHDGFVIYKCNLTCRKTAHFHCCYCTETIINKSSFQTHILNCRPRTSRPAEQSQHPPPPPFSSPPSPKGPSATSPPITPTQRASPAQHPGHSPSPGPDASPDMAASQLESEPESPEHMSFSYPLTPGLDSTPTASPAPSSSALTHCALRKDTPGNSAAATMSGAQTPERTEPASGSPDPCKMLDPRISKMQCQFCGIILNRKNFKVHVKRRHKEEFLELLNQEVHNRGPADSKISRVQCQHCGVTLNKKNFKVHMKRRHREEVSPESWGEVLMKSLAMERQPQGVIPWRKVKVRCERCGLTLSRCSFREHMRRKHHEEVSLSTFQEALNNFLEDMGLVAVETALFASHGEEGGEDEEEGRDDHNDLSLEGGEKQADPDDFLSFEAGQATRRGQEERLLTMMSSQWYPPLRNPHFLELPLESMVWIFREVIRYDGRRGYWNLSLVCKTFRTILRNDIIRNYSLGQTS
ncbi:uncharacterized protein LOC124484756 isoform X2 [Hypomesus transpacificus]|uniref:uncharacterized protein LOC124484756 isoform X2 n=1 Tax=Hypomesus transpacificus TaxID=137520 RepID=UPI001F085383|nr:uncharacterized protein LOC124484756 isoform X2 [Hypomesus transpacificus]